MICNESAYAIGLVVSNADKAFGINMDGILLMEYRAFELSLHDGPRLILREGDFSLYGDRRPLLVPSHWGSSSIAPPDPTQDYVRPFDAFPGSTISVSASLQKDSIRLRYTFEYDGQGGDDEPLSVEIDIPVLDVIRGFEDLVNTKPCQHVFESPVKVGKSQHREHIYYRDMTSPLATWKVQHTLLDENSIKDEEERQFVVFWVYPVQSNPIAQWASCGLAYRKLQKRSQIVGKIGNLVFQQGTCLSCVRDQLLSKSDEDSCIISGSPLELPTSAQRQLVG
jgi:hypothetical protein